MNLNTWQWRILIVTLVVFVIMGLFPPWKKADSKLGYASLDYGGYGLIFSPPGCQSYGVKVKMDFSRLIVQCLVLGAAAGVGVILTRNRP